MNIKVTSEEIIKPSCPTPNHLRLLPASLFDHVNTPVLMPLIFFFTSHNTSTKTSANEVLDRLKGSLPNTLSVFYPLAGRVQDVNRISCNDEGVPYVQAEVDKPLDNVVHKAEVSQLDKLLPSYGQEGYTPLLLAIQVNVFACGGLAIGVLMSHAIADAFSMFIFVKTWASMAKGQGRDQDLLIGQPNFDLWKQFPPQKSDDKEEVTNDDPDPNLIQDRPVTKWFIFSKAKIDTLRSFLFSYNKTGQNDDTSNKNGLLGNSSTSLPSFAIVLSCFIWSRIKSTCHNSVNNIIPFELYHSVNLRPGVSPPSEQSYYFGNMAVNAMVKPSIAHIDADNSSTYVEPFWWHDILRQSKVSVSKILRNDGFVRKMKEGKENLRFMMEIFERESRGEVVLHGFSNLRSLPVYEADFGWGKPVWVTSATLIYKNLVILIPAGPSSKDIVAYINLSREDMAKLENDAEFNAFVSRKHHVSSKL